MKTQRILAAIRFATNAHGTQVRKYDKMPYIVHPIRVAEMVASYIPDDDVVIAAILHDVVEDTGFTAADINAAFGSHVKNLVLEVTEVSRPEDGNRAARKAKDRDHYARASAYGQSIKVADLIDNTNDIVAHDVNFARVYLGEKRELLSRLTNAHPGLRAIAEEALEWGESVVKATNA